MTVVAVFKVNNVPVLIGDTLVSSQTSNENSIILPGSGENSSEIESYIYPVALNQKVIHFNKNLAIGLAGPVIVAKTFIREIREYILKTDNFTWEGVKSVIDEFVEECIQTTIGENFSYVLLYKDEKIVVTDGHNVMKENVDGYGDVLVAGSGTYALLEAMRNDKMEFDNDNIPDGIKGIHKVIILITRLWSSDITSQNNIKYGFGGGYEIASVVNGYIKKIGDILLTSAAAHTTENNQLMLGLNRRTTKFDYIDEYMIVRVLDIEPGESSIEANGDTIFRPNSYEKRGFIIPPVDVPVSKVQNEEIEFDKLPDLNATYIGVNLEVIAENGEFLSSCFTYWKPKRNGPILYDKKGFYWKPEIYNSMKQVAYDFMQANKKEA